jgi:hypothetical protein
MDLGFLVPKAQFADIHVHFVLLRQLSALAVTVSLHPLIPVLLHYAALFVFALDLEGFPVWAHKVSFTSQHRSIRSLTSIDGALFLVCLNHMSHCVASLF